MVINQKQAQIVKRIYQEFLDGKGCNRIAKDLEIDGILNWHGKAKWYESSIRKMLANEKYKGDALLQKTYTIDSLSKKRADNDGQVSQYYVEDSHLPSLIKRCGKRYSKRWSEEKLMHLNMVFKNWSTRRPPIPLPVRVICGSRGQIFGRKVWNSTDDRLRRIIWRCNGKYLVKGKKGCDSKHIDDGVCIGHLCVHLI